MLQYYVCYNLISPLFDLYNGAPAKSQFNEVPSRLANELQVKSQVK